MANPSTLDAGQILAIDIGATFTKSVHVDDFGLIVGVVSRQRTLYPCTPSGLVDELTKCIVDSGCERVGVGIPVELENGRVIGPGGFSYPGGPSTLVDTELLNLWLGFSPQDALRESTHRDVRVVNDASLAALGCAEGSGTELVLTLGTGLGLGLVVDGYLRPVPDVGWEVFGDGETFDEAGGDGALKRDRTGWNSSILAMVEHFATEYQATVVHLAGGNARLVKLEDCQNMDFRVVTHDNEKSLQGAARLFLRPASNDGDLR